MDRNYNFFLKNFNFNFFSYFKIIEFIVDNSEFFKNTCNNKFLFTLKPIFLKKINLSKKCINIIYF